MTNDESSAPVRRSSSFIPHPSSFSVLVLVLVGLVLTAPLLQGETLCTDDGALHVYRTVALDRAIRDGLLYPRWFPDLAYGYGFPFFVYREPLGYYTLELLHLVGLSVPNAFNLTLAGSVILSDITLFLLARDIFGPRGGLLAGIAYLTAPYVLIGPLVRGNLPEVIAFALMPLILFFFRRLIVLRQTRYFVASILAYAALFLTHNISSLLFTPLLIVYIALLAWAKRADSTLHSPLSTLRFAMRNTQHAILALVLTLGLTAFFWLPALTEQDQAQVYLTHATRGNDYHFNFISLDELLAGPGSHDPNLLNPPLHIPFGWAQLVLAVLGVFAYRRARSREQRATILAAALATIALALMALPVTLPVWDNLPLIRFVQFPWRFVGRAMLPAALLAAAAFPATQPSYYPTAQPPNHPTTQIPLRASVSPWSLFAAVFVALLFTAPLSYPRLCPTSYGLDINDVFAYERATGHIGVDPLGAYLPRSVIERPAASPLEAMYAAGRPIERFDAASLPAGAQLLDAQYGPNRADLTLSSPVDFTATYLAFAFPGWRVSIDDRPVDIQPSDPTGLITFDVPAGEHRIHVEFGESPTRALADGMSLVALFVTIASVIIIHHRSRILPTTQPSNYPTIQLSNHIPRFTLHVFIALAVFVLVKITLIDANLTPLRGTRLTNDILSGVSHPLDVTFGDQLRLLGYDLSASTARPSERVRVDFYWKAQQPLDVAYQAEVGLADADGWAWSPKHADRPRDFNNYPPTPLWPIDAYALDSFEIEVLPGTPPGDYALVAQVFNRDTLAPLSPNAATAPGRLVASIGSIRVERAARTFNAEELRIYGGERHELDDDLTLLGYNIDRLDTAPGEDVLLTFFWQAERSPQTHRTLRAELIDAAGEALTAQDIRIGGESYPTSRWSAGEQIISLVPMRVPAAAPSGEYHWRGSLLDAAGQPAATFDLRPAFHVAAPQRTFDAPAMTQRLDVQLGQFAALLGFDLARDRLLPGESIDLALYWQARAETESSFKVFVHVLDAAGRVVAQADAVPLGGLRPTTGWLPGEIISDRYVIALPGDLPIGQYHLAAGLYDPETGTRLVTSAGRDVVPLANLEVK